VLASLAGTRETSPSPPSAAPATWSPPTSRRPCKRSARRQRRAGCSRASSLERQRSWPRQRRRENLILSREPEESCTGRRQQPSSLAELAAAEGAPTMSFLSASQRRAAGPAPTTFFSCACERQRRTGCGRGSANNVILVRSPAAAEGAPTMSFLCARLLRQRRRQLPHSFALACCGRGGANYLLLLRSLRSLFCALFARSSALPSLALLRLLIFLAC
jgi:hypothetical protein